MQLLGIHLPPWAIALVGVVLVGAGLVAGRLPLTLAGVLVIVLAGGRYLFRR